MNSDLKITLSRVLEKPLQINGTDTETHYINELFKRLVFHELLNKLNLKDLYHYRDNVKYCPGKVELNFTLNKQELDLLIQVQWIKMSLNLKCYFIRQFIQQKLLELNEHITRHETITGKPLTKEYSRFFNEPKKQYELTIKNYLQWKKI